MQQFHNNNNCASWNELRIANTESEYKILICTANNTNNKKSIATKSKWNESYTLSWEYFQIINRLQKDSFYFI